MPGKLGNKVKTLKGYDFHTLEALFAGMISRLDLMSDLLTIFEIFYVLWNFLGRVLAHIFEKIEYGKRVDKGVEKGHAVNEVSGRGGGQHARQHVWKGLPCLVSPGATGRRQFVHVDPPRDPREDP